ncbi:XK-related protein 8 [Trichosurus vulpecula]|uniref:XK-related protein 8 n=1 Tax=Trichosurus vulpecula TaxID=9337 RepID=UPI00186ADDC2|nr:XK-related protein 8 [Trichosurus vulpecula]
MPRSPRACRLRDLLLTALGTGAFVLDLGADVWAAGQYAVQGRLLWAALQLAALVLSSAALQLFSWIWYRGDPADLHPGLPPGRGLALLHLLHLGYLHRCVQALKVGFALWKQEEPAEFDLDYANFISMDISMLRLFETFLEATPQLILVLHITLCTGRVEYYQWIGIGTAFICIAWALLDYHRALRSCLPTKHALGYFSSTVYFLWNLLLLCPRIVALALFTTVFPRYIAIHFLLLWVVLLLWVWLQNTDFMPGATSEWLYRGTVAVILYFSWFNVSEGRTRSRSIIHFCFLAMDSALLGGTWLAHNIPLPSPSLLPWLLPGAALCFLLGLGLRGAYYQWLHPSRQAEALDEGDGTQGFALQDWPLNRRMAKLALSFFPRAAPAKNKEVNGVL